MNDWLQIRSVIRVEIASSVGSDRSLCWYHPRDRAKQSTM